MADPLELPLSLGRRVKLDVQGELWRVAFYRRDLPPVVLQRLDRQARAGSKAAQAELEATREIRTTGKAPTLVDALAAAGRKHLSLAEAEQVSRYVLSTGRVETRGKVA